jgi:hypothetical protein
MPKLASGALTVAVLVALGTPAVAAAWPAAGARVHAAVTDFSAARRHRVAHVRRVAHVPIYKPPYYGRAYRPYAYGWAPPYAYNPYGPYRAAPFPYFPFFGYGWAW